MYILFSIPTAKTGRLLMSKFNCNGGVNPPHNADIILNYGSSISVPNVKLIFNDPSSVRNNTNKLQSLLLMERAGVNIPKLVRAKDFMSCIDYLPVVGRLNNHKSGSGFHLCLNRHDLEAAVNANCSHFLKFIPTEREFRVHVFNGKAFRIQEKIIDPTQKKVDYHIKTHSHGWIFQLKNMARDVFPTDLKQQAIMAVRAVGFVFGAVDIGVDHHGNCFVYEVNSGASLDEEGSGADRFVAEVNKYIEDNKVAVPKVDIEHIKTRLAKAKQIKSKNAPRLR